MVRTSAHSPEYSRVLLVFFRAKRVQTSGALGASSLAISTVTSQPLPFGRLEREKHIEMLFRAFHRRWSPSMDLQDSAVSAAQGDGVPSGSHVGLPGALAPLSTVTQLRITARPELQGPQCVPRRTYSIATETRDQLLVAVEESSCVCVQCCGPARACTLQAFDRQAEHVFLFQRPLRADLCCLGCCLMEMRAYTAEGQLIGTVFQRWSMFTPYFEVCDSEGNLLVRVQGSCCPVRCRSDQDFQVVSAIGENVGTIWKRWPGYNEECNMDHEYFGIDVPLTMNAETKVLLLAAAFLLNHMFFEMS
ncbi:phospholipid scramblase 2 [Chanos chanos]|uniref:Phospholipid scramblase n=1 Tax=Chanos chanos TaxID=29144 RepID=A0A6J2VBZ2_CHACN|nr:phospholipid scramblase 2-like [Chanos chanos]